MPRGWEGKRRSGVALAMRHGLEWFILLRAQRPQVGDKHPAYALAGAWFPLSLPLLLREGRGKEKGAGKERGKAGDGRRSGKEGREEQRSERKGIRSMESYHIGTYFFLTSISESNGAWLVA